jgi:hypothetical protein
VAQAHDLAILGPGRDFKTGRQRLALHRQRMVARGLQTRPRRRA